MRGGGKSHSNCAIEKKKKERKMIYSLCITTKNSKTWKHPQGMIVADSIEAAAKKIKTPIKEKYLQHGYLETAVLDWKKESENVGLLLQREEELDLKAWNNSESLE